VPANNKRSPDYAMGFVVVLIWIVSSVIMVVLANYC